MVSTRRLEALLPSLAQARGEPRSHGCEMKCMVAHQMHGHERRKT